MIFVVVFFVVVLLAILLALAGMELSDRPYDDGWWEDEDE